MKVLLNENGVNGFVSALENRPEKVDVWGVLSAVWHRYPIDPETRPDKVRIGWYPGEQAIALDSIPQPGKDRIIQFSVSDDGLACAFTFEVDPTLGVRFDRRELFLFFVRISGLYRAGLGYDGVLALTEDGMLEVTATWLPTPFRIKGEVMPKEESPPAAAEVPAT